MIKVRNVSRFHVILTSTAATVALVAATPAFGQETTKPAVPVAAQDDKGTQADKDADEIVVTGTLLRGVAPVGTNVVGMNREQITATGATNTNEVLARIPQVTNFFNQVVNSGIPTGTGVPARPDIRRLSIFGGGNATLLLLDGQRVAGVGVIYTAADPNVVPPGALAGVEVVADGGSSIYGSDAVGGVINMITRRRFTGVEVSGRYGFADDYYQYDGTLTAGTQWDTGGVYAAFTYSRHDDLFGRDRDYIHNAQLSNSCVSPTLGVTVAGVSTNYAAPGFAPGTVNQCDTSDNAAFVPAERRYAALASFNQQFGENVDLNIRGYYTNRRTDFANDEARASIEVPVTNPGYNVGLGGTQVVSFSYAPVFGQNQFTRTDLEQWGVTSNLNVKFGSQWEARFSAAYSKSDLNNGADTINSTAQTAAVASLDPALRLNPYNLSATAPAVLAGIRGRELARGRQNVFSARGVIDGTLFSWGGGDVRLAVGGEYMREEIASELSIPGSLPLPPSGGNRDVKSAFGEILIPIFGEGNRIPGFNSLLISASGRYDYYSDFGDTFNPKVGVDWRPFKELRLRGSYGTSFNAPSLADTNAVDRRLDVQQGGIFNLLLLRPGDPVFPTILRPVFVVAGGNPDLKPQTAKTFSAGFDFDVPFSPGLKLSATYWNIDFKNLISLPVNCLFNSGAPVCSRFIIQNPTIAQVNAVAPNFPVSGAASVTAAFANPFLQPYALLDARRVNLGRVKTDGVDFNASLFRKTGFGSITANIGGAYLLSRTSEFLGVTTDDLQYGFSRLNLSAGLGMSTGNFAANLSYNRNSGYDTAPTGTSPAIHVEGFETVNLFFSYNVKGEGLAKDLSFTLNVNNVFDNDPPFSNSGNSYTNGSTLGRLIQFGVSKKF